jgi:hypothetical protein
MPKAKNPVFPRLNQRQMADFLGINDVRLAWAVRQKIVEPDKNGLYPVDVVTAKWLAYERGPRARSRGREGSEFEKQRARLTRLRAEGEARKLAVLDGSLTNNDDMVQLAKTVCLRIRAKLQTALPRIARGCYHAKDVTEALKVARSEFDVALSELAVLQNFTGASEFGVTTDANGE